MDEAEGEAVDVRSATAEDSKLICNLLIYVEYC